LVFDNLVGTSRIGAAGRAGWPWGREPLGSVGRRSPPATDLSSAALEASERIAAPAAGGWVPRRAGRGSWRLRVPFRAAAARAGGGGAAWPSY